MPIRVNGLTNGSVTLSAPATGSDVALTLPAVSGTVATLNNPTFTGSTLDASSVTQTFGMGMDLLKPTSVVNASLNSGGLAAANNVASVSLNGIFSSSYTSYRIVITDILSTIAAGAGIFMRLRSGGVDESTAVYQNLGSYVATAANGVYRGSGAYFDMGQTANWIYGSSIIDIYRPFQGSTTAWTWNMNGSNASPTYANYFGGGYHTANYSADGFTLYGSSGNIYANIRVYGYRN